MATQDELTCALSRMRARIDALVAEREAVHARAEAAALERDEALRARAIVQGGWPVEPLRPELRSRMRALAHRSRCHDAVVRAAADLMGWHWAGMIDGGDPNAGLLRDDLRRLDASLEALHDADVRWRAEEARAPTASARVAADDVRDAVTRASARMETGEIGGFVAEDGTIRLDHSEGGQR